MSRGKVLKIIYLTHYPPVSERAELYLALKNRLQVVQASVAVEVDETDLEAA